MTFIGAVGSDVFALDLRQALVDAEVDTRYLREVDGPSGIAAITVDAAGENSIVVVAGANSTVVDLTTAELAAVADANVLLCQLEIPLGTVLAAAAHAAAHGTVVMLNPSPAQTLPPELVELVDVLLVNQTEAGQLGAEVIGAVAHVVTTRGRPARTTRAATAPRSTPTPRGRGRRHDRGGRRVRRRPGRLVAARARGRRPVRMHGGRARHHPPRRVHVVTDPGRDRGGTARLSAPAAARILRVTRVGHHGGMTTATEPALRDEAERLLRELAGEHATLRDDQWTAIEALVVGRRRALVVQRTGWGKSAVYFIAAKLLRAHGHGPTVIVSPLLALMRNQVASAERAGVRAATINSGNVTEWDDIHARVADNQLDVLLVSPERLNNPDFRDQVLPPSPPTRASSWSTRRTACRTGVTTSVPTIGGSAR